MANNQKQSAKKPKKKRLPLGVGDLVAFDSHIHHMTGNFGEVTAILDKDHVVIRGMGSQYADYDNRLWVALTYKPQGTSNGGDDLRDISIYVRKILYSRRALPPEVKKPKKPKPVTIIEGKQALLQALASSDSTAMKAVHVVPDAAKDQGPLDHDTSHNV